MPTNPAALAVQLQELESFECRKLNRALATLPSISVSYQSCLLFGPGSWLDAEAKSSPCYNS